MINQDMDQRVVKLEESLDLAPKLAEFTYNLQTGQDLSANRQEFNKLRQAALLYKEAGYPRLRDQIVYWLDNTIDQMDALDKLLEGTKYLNPDDTVALWENYKAGLDLYRQS